MKIRYYVCGLGYNKVDEITDYEVDFGDFDTVEEARKCFDESVRKKFEEIGDIEELKYWKIQLEECEETEDGIECVDVISEEDIFREEEDGEIPLLFSLSAEEADAIDHLTSITKMDCWFNLVEREPGAYYVRDLENGENLQLDEALSQALDGFGDEENLKSLGATPREIKVLVKTLVSIGVIDITDAENNLWD